MIGGEIARGTADVAMMRQANPNHMGRVHYGPPINKLPDELLRRIFIWLKDMLPHCPLFAFIWSPVLRVNQQWKRVAIDCSSLWTDLEISLNIPRSYFEHSKAQPLILWWLQGAAAPGVTLDQRAVYFPRARRLSLLGLPQDNGAQAFHNLTSFPLLEELELHADSGEPFAEVFISGHYPKLTRLIVSLERHFQWRYTIFSPNLQYLEIRNCGLFEYLASTRFIDGLRNMPFLENLRLLNVSMDFAEATVPAVTLSKLRYLVLRGTIEVCTALLQCFTLPLNTNISIQCLLPRDENNDVQNEDDELLHLSDGLLDLSEALRDKIAVRDDSGSLLSPPIKYMMVQQYQYPVQGLGHSIGAARLCLLWNDKPRGESLQENLAAFEAVSCERNGVHGYSGYWQDLTGIQVILTWDIKATRPHTSRPLAIWPRAICQSLPLEQVTTVSVDLDWYTTVMGIGRMCPNVTTVIAEDVMRAGPAGLRYLLDIDDHRKRRADHPHFPKLKTVVLDRSKFRCPTTTLCQELDRLRLSLRGLRISGTLTLEKCYLVRRDFAVGRIAEKYLPKLSEIKAAFPKIDISLLGEDFLQLA